MTKRITIQVDADDLKDLIENIKLATERREHANEMTIDDISHLSFNPKELLYRTRESALAGELSAYTELGYWIFKHVQDGQP